MTKKTRKVEAPRSLKNVTRKFHKKRLKLAKATDSHKCISANQETTLQVLDIGERKRARRDGSGTMSVSYAQALQQRSTFTDTTVDPPKVYRGTKAQILAQRAIDSAIITVNPTLIKEIAERTERVDKQGKDQERLPVRGIVVNIISGNISPTVSSDIDSSIDRLRPPAGQRRLTVRQLRERERADPDWRHDVEDNNVSSNILENSEKVVEGEVIGVEG